MADKEKEIFYVGVNNPSELRRTLLESSREMIQSLQRFEKFKEIRERKSVAIKNLRADIKEINKLVAKLKTNLPKTSLRAIKKQPPKEEKPKKAKKKKAEPASKVEVKKVEPKKEISELEKLESELSNIEEKLGSLV